MRFNQDATRRARYHTIHVCDVRAVRRKSAWDGDLLTRREQSA
jgi:hypothetical protein